MASSDAGLRAKAVKLTVSFHLVNRPKYVASWESLPESKSTPARSRRMRMKSGKAAGTPHSGASRRRVSAASDAHGHDRNGRRRHAGNARSLANRLWPNRGQAFGDLAREPRHAAIVKIGGYRTGFLRQGPAPLGVVT